MPFEQRSGPGTVKYTVKVGDTLKRIAEANAPLTPEELAVFNFGTSNNIAVNRALFEIVGAPDSKINKDDARLSEFGGDEVSSKRGTGIVLIPKRWKAEKLPHGYTYKIKVKKPRMAPAVSIEALDKWFVPGKTGAGGEGEICTVKYALEGVAELADKVVFDVYASNYCAATIDADGKITYADHADPRVFTGDQPETAAIPNPGTPYEISTWSGKSSAAGGLLKPRADDKPRFVNVAFSPYTAHLRFLKKTSKSANDKDARIELFPLWPRWETGPTGAIDPANVKKESLKITWKIHKCSRLTQGQLLIWDKTDKVVFRRALPKGELTEGKENAFEWDGKLADGTTLLKPENMPYRVQLQAHTDRDDADGLALAAMHTEVRLFVHPKTGDHKKEGPNKGKAHTDPNSLGFFVAPFCTEEQDPDNAAKAPAADSATSRWYQYKLALAGYHPGPADASVADLARIAIEEFQRSNPKGAAPNYARLTITGNTADADTKVALQALTTAAYRWMFGDPAGRTDYKRETDGEKKALDDILTDKDKSLIVWVNDRHYNTEHWAGAIDASLESVLMNNYRGAYTIGDERVEKDADSIARPCLPVRVTPTLMRKTTAFDATEVVLSDLSESEQKLMRAAMRMAIGPLRIDWSFEEIGEDLDVIDTNPATYDSTRVRSRTFIEQLVEREKETHEGKEYTNAKEVIRGGKNCCGIRPAAIADYYRAPFGGPYGGAYKTMRLEPCFTFDDTTDHAICAHVYDDLGQAKVYPDAIGGVNVYLHPSRVAGDGYRFRARFRFDAKSPAESKEFPNAKVLAGRYPEPPQAHTAKLRNWRKTSFRGYMKLAPGTVAASWPAVIAPIMTAYRSGYVHYVHEGADPATPRTFGLADLLTGADLATVVNRNVTTAPCTGKTVTLNAECAWPFSTAEQMGLEAIEENTGTLDVDSAYNQFYTTANAAWWAFNGELMYRFLQGIEKHSGLMKGHFVVEFVTMPKVTIRMLNCDFDANHRVAEIDQNNTHSKLGTACAVGCMHPPSGGAAAVAATYVDWCTQDYDDGVVVDSAGLSGGGNYLFPPSSGGGPDTWAHEIAHNRHFSHAPGYPLSATPPGGAEVTHHDAAGNPNYGTGGSLDADPNKSIARDQGWDRCCTMSYTNQNLGTTPEKQYFCGKCLLKNRGWAVEALGDLPGILITVKPVATIDAAAASATIVWTTDVPGTSKVEYGLTTAYGTDSAAAAKVTNHSRVLAGLTRNKEYHFKARSSDANASEVLSDDFVFKVPPFISAVASSEITPKTAKITWKTDVPCSSKVEFGPTIAYASPAKTAAGPVTEHVLTLDGLTPGTDYHFRVKSKDAGGHEVEGVDVTLKTLALPVVSDVASKDVKSSTATITWKTDVPCSSKVELGLDTTYAEAPVSKSPLVKEHAIELSKLAGGKAYHFRVVSTDAHGNEVKGVDATLATKASPVISAVKCSRAKVDTATIEWTTDIGADSKVEFGKDVSYGGAPVVAPAEATAHAVTLTGLEADTLYHFRVVSKIAGGSDIVSADATFETPPA